MGTWGRARLLPWEGMNQETKASLRGFLRSTVPSPPPNTRAGCRTQHSARPLHSSHQPALKLCVPLKTKRSLKQVWAWPLLYP